MRKYKQVKEKKVVYSIDEWMIIEHRAAKLAMKTGTYTKRISVDGEIKNNSVGDITPVMKALRIIGGNINQIAKKANETHRDGRSYSHQLDELHSQSEVRLPCNEDCVRTIFRIQI